jgi:hypothetical protein
MIFRQVQACRRIIALHTIFLYCSWQLIWWLLFVRLVLTSSSHSLGVPLPLLLYPRGVKLQGRYPSWLQHDSYSDSILLVYFTHIFIDIIIYAIGSTLWSSGIIWMVGQVIADPSLGLLSLCGVVPQVPILIISITIVAQ